MRCRFCQSDQTIKYGKIRNKQRYQCKACHIHFVQDVSYRGIDIEKKLQALKLLKEGMGFRSTARFLGVTLTSVQRWFKNKSKIIRESHNNVEVSSLKEVESVELDELFHYIKKK